VRSSNASPGRLEELAPPHRVAASSGREGVGVLVACVLVMVGGSCSPGYLDVTGRDATRDSGMDAPPADAEGCQAEAGCPNTTAGWALHFDGIADCAKALRPVSKDFTLEAWVVLDAPGSGTYWWEGLPVFWADLDAQASDFSATLLNGILRFVTGSASGDAIVSSKSTIPTSQWVHIAITRSMSSGAVTLFINGHADASGTGTTVALTGQAAFWVFCSDTGLHAPGTIDELRAWNVARGEADIQATMHKRLAGSEPGLVGYWRFDDGSGSSATDSSPTGNPLMLGDSAAETAPTWVVSTAPIDAP
jgi:hypothetical protein